MLSPLLGQGHDVFEEKRRLLTFVVKAVQEQEAPTRMMPRKEEEKDSLSQYIRQIHPNGGCGGGSSSTSR